MSDLPDGCPPLPGDNQQLDQALQRIAELTDENVQLVLDKSDALDAKTQAEQRADAAEKRWEVEEKDHAATMKQRDRLEDAIQQTHINLGGDGEWSNLHDLAAEIIEKSAAAKGGASDVNQD